METKLKGASLVLLACLALGDSAAGQAGDGPAAKPKAKGKGMPAKAKGPVFVTGDADILDAVAFAPGNRLLAGGGLDKKVRIWDVRDDNKLKRTFEAKGYVRKVTFSADGKVLAAGADDGVIYLWDAGSGKRKAE